MVRVSVPSCVTPVIVKSTACGVRDNRAGDGSLADLEVARGNGVRVERLVELDDKVDVPGNGKDRSHRRAGGRHRELGIHIKECRSEIGDVPVTIRWPRSPNPPAGSSFARPA